MPSHHRERSGDIAKAQRARTVERSNGRGATALRSITLEGVPVMARSLDEFLAEKRGVARASYDTRGKETDPVIDRVLRDAENRKAATVQLPNPDMEAEAVMRGLGIKPSPAEAAFSQSNAQNDHATGAKFWERLEEKFKVAEQPLKNRIEDYSMSVSPIAGHR